MARADSWHLAEGDTITADLTALRLLGGAVRTRPTWRSTRSPTHPWW